MKRTALISLLIINVICVSAQTFYVSTTGNDKNPGTIDKPFATLEKARYAVRASDHTQTTATVYLRGGIYALRQSFVLSKEDGGTETNPVVYSAYKDEKVYLRGSKAIQTADFKRITDASTLKRIDAKLQSKILELDLTALNIRNIKAYADKFNDDGGIIELFMDDERMPLSRYPNVGNMTMRKVIINGGGQETKNADWANFYAAGQTEARPPRPGVFEYRDPHTSKWLDLLDRGVWLKGFWRIPWQNEAVRVAKIDTAAQIITLKVPVPGGIGNKYTRPEGNGKEPYWLMNLLEEVDLPGEWAVDFKDKKLYFYPPKKITNSNLRIADINAPLVQMTNTANVQLKGIIVEENMSNGIQILGGESNLIAGCTVRNITKTGIVVDGGKNHTVLSNDVYNLGGGGVWLRGGDENSVPRVAANFKVVNNHIYHFSQLTRIYEAGINAGFTGGGGGGHHVAVGMYIAHNLIHDTPHVGVLYGSWDTKFEYNEIFDYCKVSDDMGAFYCYDLYERMGNQTIAYNFIHNSPIGDGIYFDNDHRNVHVYGNLVALFSDPKRRGTGFLYKSGSQAKKNNPQSMECYNNIAVNCNFGFQFLSFPQMVDSNKVYNNVSALSTQMAFRNRMLEWSNKERDTVNIPTPAKYKNVSYKEDPGFVDLKNFQLSLKPNSRIFTDLPEFKAIPLDKIGLFVDEYRKKLPTDQEIKRFEALPAKGGTGTEILDRN
ncbi:MAG: right-handed parallel beta-helix repeat-containing protein [Bacteroidales bacterium]